MPQAKHHFIYSAENQEVASQISAELKKLGHPVEQHPVSEDKLSGKLSDLGLTNVESPILLLLTDNFLKSANCMHQALPKVKAWADTGWLMPVVASGTQVGEDGEMVEVPTSFERVSNVIQYMNHWQDKYLQLRKMKRKDGGHPGLDEEIATTKEVSADVGELLRFLRNLEHNSLEEFQHNDYAVLRRALGEEVAPTAAEVERDATISEHSLVQMIEGSSDELMSENAKIEAKEEAAVAETEIEEPVTNELAEVILPEGAAPDEPGIMEAEDGLDAEEIALMNELEYQQPSASAENVEQPGEAHMADLEAPQNQIVDVDDDEELNSILDEVLAEEGLGDDDSFEFLPENSDNPDDFNLDALLEDEPEFAAGNGHPVSDEPATSDNEDLGTDVFLEDQEEVVELEDGDLISPEEILEHALDLFAEGETKEGLEHLQSTVAKNPENTTLRYYYAYSLARYAKDSEAAKENLQTLLKQEPQHPEAWYLLGELAESQGDYEGARMCFEKAVEINPDYPDIHYRLGLLTVQFFPGEAVKAGSYLRTAIAQDPENTDAEYALANLLNEQLGQPHKAVEHFERVLELLPEHPYANYDLALLHHQLGNLPEALVFYKKAIDTDPEIQTEQNDLAFGLVVETAAKKEVVEADDEEEGMETSAAEPVAPISEGPVVLITGGTAGIGRATAEVFAKNGYRVIITGRRAERLDELKKGFYDKYQADIQALNFDVRDAAAVKTALESLPEGWENVDILINNAGLSRGLAPIHEGSIENWDTMIDTNVKGLLYLTRAIAPQMVARRRGHIINVASSAGKEVYPGGNVYCATKAAVETLTNSMRIDLFKHNVRVSQVSPGHVEETEFARVRFDWDEERAEKTYENFQPLKSGDVAEVIYFMATRPPHVNVQDVFMFGTQQAGSNFIDRSGRGDGGRPPSADG